MINISYYYEYYWIEKLKYLPFKIYYNNRIATINVPVLQNDMKLGTVIKFEGDMGIDVLVIQEVS